MNDVRLNRYEVIEMNKISARNSKLWALGTSVVLGIGFLLSRFTFFDMHGMTQWPFVLFVFGLIVIAVSIIFKAHRVMISVPVGYIVGFVSGILFNSDTTDPGGGLVNNAWQIWTAVFLSSIVLGLIWVFDGKRKQKANTQ